MQLEQFESPEKIFQDYAYFSSYSESWLNHARVYSEHTMNGSSLGAVSLVLESGQQRWLPVAILSDTKASPSWALSLPKMWPGRRGKRAFQLSRSFSGLDTARELQAAGQQADLMYANNVLPTCRT